jgi:hypothetical protein
MYILYLDESGNPDDPSDRHFVLGGAAVFERAAHFLTRALDEVQATHVPGLEPITSTRLRFDPARASGVESRRPSGKPSSRA